MAMACQNCTLPGLTEVDRQRRENEDAPVVTICLSLARVSENEDSGPLAVFGNRFLMAICNIPDPAWIYRSDLSELPRSEI
jgi:hypothetical protein